MPERGGLTNRNKIPPHILPRTVVTPTHRTVHTAHPSLGSHHNIPRFYHQKHVHLTIFVILWTWFIPETCRCRWYCVLCIIDKQFIYLLLTHHFLNGTKKLPKKCPTLWKSLINVWQTISKCPGQQTVNLRKNAVVLNFVRWGVIHRLCCDWGAISSWEQQRGMRPKLETINISAVR